MSLVETGDTGWGLFDRRSFLTSLTPVLLRGFTPDDEKLSVNKTNVPNLAHG